MPNDYEILEFKTSKDWRVWLDKNHDKANGVWIHFYKKNSGIKTINRSDALDHALCYGWIDGQANKYDDMSWLQKFTPRRKRSMWSKRNIEHVSRLTKTNLMMPAGLREVEKAKADGRWDNAYAGTKDMIIPDDSLKAVKKNKKALITYETLNKSQLFTIYFNLTSAKKPETRARRFDKYINMLENGDKP